MIEPITDHVDRGLARLIEQYKRATTFRAWISVYLRRLQAIEDACWELLTERSIDSAIGVQLDQIGGIVNRKRGSLDDDSYRIALRAEILVLRSDGRMGDIINVAKLAIPPGYDFLTHDEGTATIRFVLLQPALFDVNTLFRILGRTRAGGVRFLFQYVTSAPSLYFRWGATSSDIGWGDAVSSTGGLLASVVTP